MNLKKISSSVLFIGFLALLALPSTVMAATASPNPKNDPDVKAVEFQGCLSISPVKSDLCGSGLVCEIINFTGANIPGPVQLETDNCSESLVDPTDGDCDGVCVDVSKSGYGLDFSNFGKTGIGQTSDLKGTIATLINVVLGFLGILAVVFIIIGGFKMMTAAGNEDQSASGKQAITNGIIGLVVIFAAWAIASFVIGQLQSSTAGTPTPIAVGKCLFDNEDSLDTDDNNTDCSDPGNTNTQACCDDLIGTGCAARVTEIVCELNKPDGVCAGKTYASSWDSDEQGDCS